MRINVLLHPDPLLILPNILTPTDTTRAYVHIRPAVVKLRFDQAWTCDDECGHRVSGDEPQGVPH